MKETITFTELTDEVFLVVFTDNFKVYTKASLLNVILSYPKCAMKVFQLPEFKEIRSLTIETN